MRQYVIAIAAAACAAASTVTTAAAQVPLVPGALSISGGVELPQGEGGTLLKQGLTGSVGYRLGIPLTPFAVRAEAGISRFDADAGVRVAGVNLSSRGTTQILSLGASGEMTVLPLIVFRGYVVGGVNYSRATGEYGVGSVGFVSQENSGVGYSVGVGAEFRLPILPAAGVEVRYRYSPNVLGGVAGLRSIPVTVRLTF